MEYKEKLILWLSLFDFLSYKKREKLFEIFENENVFETFKNSYSKLSDIINNVQFAKMVQASSEDFINNYILDLKKNQIDFITIKSENYPECFVNIDNPPHVLYLKGSKGLLNYDMNIAVVGTRTPSNYGKDITEKLVRDLTINKFCIVSGLAEGIDTISHKTCLNNNGKTIAVIASGLNKVYPSSNINLFKQIIEKGGLVITEKAPNETAMSYDFPVRNRLIAGLSAGVLITEAGIKSGTMHTKDYAISYNKELFVVPGNITNPKSEGCNRIIREIPSTMVLDVNDILSVFNKPKYKKVDNSFQLSIDEAQIFNLLKNGEMSFDEILINTNFDVKTLSMLLTTLNFRGIIKKLAGNIYSL